MKRLLAFVFAIILCLFSSCGEPNIKENGGYTFTDDLGRKISVGSYSRVAALTGSLGEIWLLAGGNVAAIAEDAWSELDLSLDESTVNLGSSHAISKESVLSCNPDLVIASSKLTSHLELEESLENSGITVIYFDVSDLEGYLRVLKIFTDITNRADLYEKNGVSIDAEVNAIISRNKDKEPQKVLVLRASSASIKVKNSDGTMLGGMLRDLGCINIADSNETLLEELSVEKIVLTQPDRIFVVQMGEDMESIKTGVDKLFKENPLWYELDAVKEGRVHFMEKRLYNMKPNVRFAEAYKGLETILNEE